jgi:hypothetical protein
MEDVPKRRDGGLRLPDLDAVVRQRLAREDSARTAERSIYACTVTSSDPTGYVQAVVRLDGKLARLHIKPHAMYDCTATELADACTAAIWSAGALRARELAIRLSRLEHQLADSGVDDLAQVR